MCKSTCNGHIQRCFACNYKKCPMILKQCNLCHEKVCSSCFYTVNKCNISNIQHDKCSECHGKKTNRKTSIASCMCIQCRRENSKKKYCLICNNIKYKCIYGNVYKCLKQKIICTINEHDMYIKQNSNKDYKLLSCNNCDKYCGHMECIECKNWYDFCGKNNLQFKCNDHSFNKKCKHCNKECIHDYPKTITGLVWSTMGYIYKSNMEKDNSDSLDNNGDDDDDETESYYNYEDNEDDDDDDDESESYFEDNSDSSDNDGDDWETESY
eukprot:545971_1